MEVNTFVAEVMEIHADVSKATDCITESKHKKVCLKCFILCACGVIVCCNCRFRETRNQLGCLHMERVAAVLHIRC